MQSVPYGALGCVVPGGQRLEARGSCLNRLDQDIASVEPPASPLLHTSADVGLSFCSPCGTNNGLYFVLEFDRYFLNKHTPKDARDHHNNRLDGHQYQASLTSLENHTNPQ
jgi:hypothetical protein